MADRTPLREASAPPTANADELSLAAPAAPETTELAKADLRELLPGVEPERQVDDWGRSERIEGLMDQTLVEFFYRLWFRCEVEGIENIPDEGEIGRANAELQSH